MSCSATREPSPARSRSATSATTTSSPATTRAGWASGSRASSKPGGRCASRSRSSASSRRRRPPRSSHASASCDVIDTHAHLDALDENPADVVARAGHAGVSRILTVGAAQAVSLADRFENVYAVVGVHPHDALTGDIDEIRELQRHPKVVAVGETGLDWFRNYATPEAQRAMFEAQLGLAAELGKPVVIHTRAADDDTLAALAGFDGTVVLHCFSSPRLLPEALERCWYVSFAGNATFPNASELRLAATQVPADRILAETDSPYLAPQAVRGRRNEPAYVVHTVAALARARGEDPGELAEQIDANASACFRL